MSHANARLTVHARLLIVQRVASGRPRSHVAKELGVSRKTVRYWLERFASEGHEGLRDRSTRPRTSPTRTSAVVEEAVLAARTELRCGPVGISDKTNVPARTVSRILARHGVPHLADCDPITGVLIRASRVTAERYERERPGELVHIDVKKLGRIPDGGGWRALGRAATVDHKHKKTPIGFDYVHALVDDYTRVAYAEVLPDETGKTSAEFLLRAAAAFADAGITTIERVISDNALAYRRSNDFKAAVAAIGAVQRFIKPQCPWTNGKVERSNRTMQTEWAYRRPYKSNTERAAALAPWLEHYNTQRNHSALGGLPPVSRLEPK